MKAPHIKTALFLLLAAFIILLSMFPGSARAQSETGYDVVAEVNALRASRGLEPYTTDSWIMDYAQQHTQYQADTTTSTHIHSDGSYAWDIGLNENVAVGTAGYISASIAVNQIWQDWGHLKPMIGYESGQAGAGVALGADGNTYYTLNVRPGSPVAQNTPLPGQTALPAQVTAPFIPLITNTPNPEGIIIHIVGAGESLWGIAISYGVTMDDIRGLNNMAAADTTIYEGQRLVIRTNVQPPLAPTPAGAQPTSQTPLPLPSATATATRASTPTPAPSAAPTATPRAPFAAFWQDKLSSHFLAGAVGAFAGTSLTLLLVRLTRRRNRRALPLQASAQENEPEEKPSPEEPE